MNDEAWKQGQEISRLPHISGFVCAWSALMPVLSGRRVLVLEQVVGRKHTLASDSSHRGWGTKYC